MTPHIRLRDHSWTERSQLVVAAMGIGWFCWKRSSLLKREQASSCDFDVVLQITWMSLLTNKLFDGR
ncbi:hypothetical protein F444_10686 [Phytophthora nicotianae P1976]|uniref:Uncharacterized protein n=1 Tax=Phytophthora nicotianae P1976 TaxID=1317066 RepID=A0A081A3A1_PHYNI|nr:hypothetical protein F444_10686 [Phytophthora nicotianae P1976]